MTASIVRVGSRFEVLFCANLFVNSGEVAVICVCMFLCYNIADHEDICTVFHCLHLSSL